jgi:hypothetical protein
VHQAKLRLDHDVVASMIAVRSGLAISGDTRIDQLWVDRTERLVVHLVFLQAPGHIDSCRLNWIASGSFICLPDCIIPLLFCPVSTIAIPRCSLSKDVKIACPRNLTPKVKPLYLRLKYFINFLFFHPPNYGSAIEHGILMSFISSLGNYTSSDQSL